MGVLFDLLIPHLQQNFGGSGMEVVPGPPEFVRFPAKHGDVGDVHIYDDEDELTVVYGNFTHCHYGKGNAGTSDWTTEAVSAVLSDLEALFNDQLRMWGSHSMAGGIVREGEQGANLWEAEGQQYVWSGPVDRAA